MTTVVVPPLTDAWGGITSDEEEIALWKTGLIVLEANGEAEPVPGILTTFGEHTYEVANGSGGGGASDGLAMSDATDVRTHDLGNGSPVIESEADTYLFLEGDVADKDGTAQHGWPGWRQRQRLKVDVGVWVWVLGRNGRGLW